MPNLSEAFPSKFLKASDLNGQQAVVTIDRAEFETLNNERKLALYFVGKTKAMILNKTNANAIGKLYGDDTDAWHGQKVTLIDAVVDFKGEMVHALRVMPPQKAQQFTKPESGRQPPAQTIHKTSVGDAMDDEIPFAPEWRG